MFCPDYPVSCAECLLRGGFDDCLYVHMPEMCSEEKKAKYKR